MASSKAGVRTELYRDQFGVLLQDLNHRMLELKWLEGSASMTDDDFKAWLDRFSAEAETRRQPYLVINVREFRHRPGPEVAAWRDEHIIPRYNRAGVTKFAFLLPEGSAGASGSPAAEPPGNFPTGYFDTPAKIEAWFSR
ncbi:MAG TPA: hypothetical protein VIJ03_06880 [Candidatus Dormibacteraeota bacterium]